MKNTIVKYCEYNLWANTLISEKLKHLSSSLLDTELKSSFTTLHKMVYHIWDAEYIWLERLKGNKVVAWPSSSNSADPIGSFTKTSKSFVEFLVSEESSFFTISMEYTNLSGQKFCETHIDMIMHVFNHSTFHRGQLIVMLRNLGINTLPQTDYITYVRS